MENKKVLIIAYYWPPSGGSGVQRWLKFVKYLPAFGWEPYVFTPENPAFDLKDPSLLKDVPEEAEVIHFPIWEPYDAFFRLSKFLGKKPSAKPSELVKGKKKSLFEKISTWIRGNFLIPDPRIFWVKPSVKFLRDFLEENRIKTIITTGPPHSMHLIGYHLKMTNPRLKWIADFRDPWSEWGLLDSLQVSDFVRRKHKKLEKKVLTLADIVTTITPFYVRHFERLGGRPVELLTNGFDESDFADLTLIHTAKFTIRHMGVVNERCDPKPFMLALEQLMKADDDFAKNVTVEFVGEVNSDFKTFITKTPGLSVVTKLVPSIPHKQLIPLYGSSSLLLLILTGYKDAEGYMPGKLFEYIATGLPILGVGPEKGDASALLNETKGGRMIESENIEGIIHELKKIYLSWKNNTDKRMPSPACYRYSRRAITEQLTQLLSK